MDAGISKRATAGDETKLRRFGEAGQGLHQVQRRDWQARVIRTVVTCQKHNMVDAAGEFTLQIVQNGAG